MGSARRPRAGPTFFRVDELAARERAGGGAGEFAEDCAGHQAGAACVVEIEEAAYQFACRIQAGDHFSVGINDLAFAGYAQAAEGEGDSAGYREGHEWWFVD